jgi:peptidoglycan hydrolase-like protein with peptidoglycan-binding domain
MAMLRTPFASIVGLAVAAMLALTGCGPTTASGAPSSGTSTSVVTANPSTASPSAAATPTPSATSASPTPAPTATTADGVLAPGASGDKVRELQARLAQLFWYDGAVTGTYDDKTVAAVSGFQAKRGLPASGTVDQPTWDTLVAMTHQPTADELNNALTAGPALYAAGASGDAVRDIQVRLRQLAWYSGVISGTYDSQTVTGVKGFQGKRGIPVTGEVDQRTLDRLKAMTRTPTGDEKNNVTPAVTATGPIDSRCLTGRVLCIDKNTRKLRWMVDGQVVKVFDVRFGSELTPTREGSFTVFQKSRDHVSTIYHTAMPFAMFFSGGQAVHYSADFAARGYNGSSHGCVNVRDYNGIKWLFDQVSIGTSVIVYRS